MTKYLTRFPWMIALMLALASPLAGQTKDSLIKADTVFGPTRITNTYLRVSTAPPGALKVSPKAVSLSVSGNSQQFTAIGASAVTWSATGGPISSAGLYWPGTTAGTYRVIASSGVLADTAVVTISGGSAPPPPPPPSTGKGNLANFDGESGVSGQFSLYAGMAITSGGAYAGQHAVGANITAGSGDNAAALIWSDGTRHADLFLSFALNVLVSPPSGLQTQKMVVFRDNGNAPNQFAEMNQIGGSWILSWLFTESGPNHVIAALGKPTSPGWHTFKMHLKCTAPATMTWGKDGVENVASLATAGAACAKNPDTITFGGTLNAGSGNSQFQFDNIHIGTVDPGWP